LKLSSVGLSLLLLIPACRAFSQTKSGATSGRLTVGPGIVSGVTNFDTPSLLREKVVSGQPYSANRVSEHTQTLADGTHIKQRRAMSHEYRDSEGRIRTEHKLFNGSRVPVEARREAPLLVQIFDPVAGYSYTLDSQKMIAHRVALPSQITESRPTRPKSGEVTTSTFSPLPVRGPFRRTMKKESLGTEMIDGILATGTRVTVTTPKGEEGNDRPLTRTCEHWQSEEMALTLRTKCSDPRTGETIMRFDNIDRTEPDPVLFQVPPEYTVVEDEGSFAIGFKTP
jgi:hypothetical protein